MTITHEYTESLSVTEQFALITDIQNVPTTVTVQEDGSEYVVYSVTPASDLAGAKLMAAFWPAITAAARRTKLRGNQEEAEAVALEAFVRAVREFDLTADTPFHHIVPNVMRNAVSRADREESTPLTIPETQVARYHRVMHAHGLSVAAAHDAIKADPAAWLLSPEAFLTIHLALHETSPIDAPRTWGGDDAAEVVGTETASHEEAIVARDYARWLLAQTTDRQESICRLAYGFTDGYTESLRVSHGYREGDVLDDLQTADCLEMARSTVARDRLKALATMRTATENEMADE